MKKVSLLWPLLAATSCAASAPTAAPPGATTPPAPLVAVTAPPPEAPPKFENPGGMWMPSQMAAHAETLKSLGLAIDPAELGDPTSGVLGAVVSLGGCSASFVSSEGLVITNHHCATRALQQNSTPQQNMLKDGFIAKTRADERSNGPASRVFVTQKVSEVTPAVLAGIDAVKDDQARFKKIESRQKDLVAACEKGRPQVRCTVAKFYEGAQYFQIEQLEIRDVRLVYAPPASIGNYGGEIDNWRWPRHTGDFTVFRAYVGKDGQPADYSAENVPFHPPHHLKLATKALEPGDLVMVAGYPGRTYQLLTHTEVEDAVQWGYPHRLEMTEQYIGVAEALAKEDKAVAIKAASLLRGLNNVLTNTKGQLDGLIKGGLAAEKTKASGELAAFIDSDPKRKAEYGGVLDAIAAEYVAAHATREKDAALREVLRFARMADVGHTLVRMAEERAKPDAERDPEYQQRNWKRQSQGLAELDRAYDRKLDKALFALALKRIAARPDADRSEVLDIVLGKGKKASDETIAKALDTLYATTKLEDAKVRVALFEKASLAQLKASADPMIKLGLALRPLSKAADDRDERLAGRMAVLKPRYIAALRAFVGKEIAPDANGTLRITYGTVRGYRPTADAPVYRPFTTLTETVAKATGQEPFDAPARLLDAAKARKVGPYADARLGDVPVDFLADLHITGGNSGSATLNAKGELVGLAFDGNYEAMASDWLFQPSIARSIHVDLRYVLWILDAVDGADALLEELGVPNAVR
jgi:hypothetical protein